MPSTFVVTNSDAPSSIDFSTCDSAAAFTITSTPATSSRTSAASRMSPWTNESRSWLITSARFSTLPGVGERVERDDLVLGVREEVADDVRRDEPGPAGDEYARHGERDAYRRRGGSDSATPHRARPACGSSRSTRYSGRCSTTRWIRARYSPTSASTKPCTPSTKTTSGAEQQRPREVRPRRSSRRPRRRRAPWRRASTRTRG